MAKLLVLFLMMISIDGGAITRSSCKFRRSFRTAAARGLIRHVFIFGDSFFDAGNNNYINTTTLDKADFWPYGETYFRQPTGRFSDGRLISDFIGGVVCKVTTIAEHANLPLIPPYLRPGRNHEKTNYHGVNFASAGAGALSLTFQGMVIDLRTQLKYYKRELGEISKKMGGAEVAAISSSAVYMFSIGTNDYISPFLQNSSRLSSHDYVEMVIGNLSGVLKAIHKRGGRKFVFLNLGELGCLPGLRILQHSDEYGCLEEASELAQMHNQKLSKMLSKMEHQLLGFQYFLYDFNATLAQMIDHPSEYGLKEGKEACCGSGDLNGIFSCGGKRMMVREYELCRKPSEFVFWDSYHLTQMAYQHMAHQMWAQQSSHNLKHLFLLCHPHHTN